MRYVTWINLSSLVPMMGDPDLVSYITSPERLTLVGALCLFIWACYTGRIVFGRYYDQQTAELQRTRAALEAMRQEGRQAVEAVKVVQQQQTDEGPRKGVSP